MTAIDEKDDAADSPPVSKDFQGVELVDVRKAYVTGDRKVEAVRGVNLSIHQPGLYAVMGPSGSGKSSLLHLLGGLDRPDSGTVEISGRRIDTLGEQALTRYRRRDIGIIFQQFNLLPTMTAIENVTLPGILDGMSVDEARTRGLQLLDELGVKPRADHRPDALSGGEQQRVAIARSLLFEPSVVLADEPTGSLDSASSDRLWALLDELATNREVLILMVTHEPSAAVRCGRVYVLRDGVIAGSFDVEGMDESELVHRATHTGRS
ncbi:MAG: ABC transporter ATP-binding protein [Phycisphaerales bacterium]|nr:ABC transporter ATP-binding protein [Phycisphaerales bacterium]